MWCWYQAIPFFTLLFRINFLIYFSSVLGYTVLEKENFACKERFIETLHKNSWRVKNTRYHTFRLFVFDIQKSRGEKSYFHILGHTLSFGTHSLSVFILIKYFVKQAKENERTQKGQSRTSRLQRKSKLCMIVLFKART